MREIRTSGSVRDGGGDVPIYSAASSSPHSDGTEGGHADEHDEWNTCPCCGGRMIIIETFEPGCQPRLWPLPSIGLDSS